MLRGGEVGWCGWGGGDGGGGGGVSSLANYRLYIIDSPIFVFVYVFCFLRQPFKGPFAFCNGKWPTERTISGSTQANTKKKVFSVSKCFFLRACGFIFYFSCTFYENFMIECVLVVTFNIWAYGKNPKPLYMDISLNPTLLTKFCLILTYLKNICSS